MTQVTQWRSGTGLRWTVMPALITLLARNLVEHLDVPGFLVAPGGDLTYFNDACGDLIGRRFAELGRLPRERWNTIGPRNAQGQPIESEGLPLSRALRDGEPSHGRFHVQTDRHGLLEVDVIAFPLKDSDGFHGASVMFWPVAS